MITIRPTEAESTVTTPSTTTPTLLKATEHILPVLSTVVRGMSTGASFILKTVGFEMGTFEVVEIDYEGVVDAEEIARALVRSPETDFNSFDAVSPDSPLVTGIRTYYGPLFRGLFLALGDKGFLAIDGKYLTLSR